MNEETRKYCKLCGRELKNKKSIEIGFKSSCYKNNLK